MSNSFLYLVAVLIWGSTFFAIEFQLGMVEPEVSIVYRYAIAAALLFAWSRFRGLNLRFGLKEHGWFVLLGFFLFGLNYILVYRAQIHITSALSAIVFATVLWMNIINARIFFGVRAGRSVVLGSVLGIAGMITVFAPQIGDLSFSDSVFFGLLVAISAAVIASFGNMVSQAAQKRKLPVIQSNAWGMFYGMILTAVIAIVQGRPFVFDWSAAYVTSLVYLAVFGSVAAFGAYLTLLGRIGAHKAGYATVMFPVVALILSTLFEGLAISANLIFGTLLVLAGNLFVLLPPGSRRNPGSSAGFRKEAAREPA